jgi:hypothetical protein
MLDVSETYQNYQKQAMSYHPIDVGRGKGFVVKK